MKKKERTLKGKIPSRRKFFKTVAVTGAATAATLLCLTLLLLLKR